jgi:hypothetical protein
MAKLFRVGKLPTIYQQTGTQAIQPLTSAEALTRQGYTFGQEEEITSSEFENLKARYGLGAPIYAETATRPETGTTLERISPYEKLPAYLPTPQQLSTYRTGLEAQTEIPRLKTEKAGIWERLKTAMGGLTGFGTTALETTRAQYRLPEIEQQLTAADKEIADIEASYARGAEAIRQKRVAMPLITGELAGLERQKAIEMNTAYAKRNAIAGDYDRAYKNLTTALNLKYQDKQSEIQGLQTQLEAVRDQMTEADKLVADRMTYQLTLAQNMLEREYQAEDTKNKIITDIMSKYPLAKVSYDDTIGSAMQKIAPYAEKTYMLELQKAEADIAATYALSDTRKLAGTRKTEQPISGLFSKTELAQMQAGGLNNDLATAIYQAIMKGESLEEIRQDLRSKNLDPALLDVFDRVKPIYKILGQEKPTTAGDIDWSNLDKMENEGLLKTFWNKITGK